MRFKLTARTDDQELGSLTCHERDVQNGVQTLAFLSLGAFRNDQGRIEDAPEITITITAVAE